jgi:hypothetical protein
VVNSCGGGRVAMSIKVRIGKAEELWIGVWKDAGDKVACLKGTLHHGLDMHAELVDETYDEISEEVYNIYELNEGVEVIG